MRSLEEIRRDLERDPENPALVSEEVAAIERLGKRFEPWDFVAACKAGDVVEWSLMESKPFDFGMPHLISCLASAAPNVARARAILEKVGPDLVGQHLATILEPYTRRDTWFRHRERFPLSDDRGDQQIAAHFLAVSTRRVCGCAGVLAQLKVVLEEMVKEIGAKDAEVRVRDTYNTYTNTNSLELCRQVIISWPTPDRDYEQPYQIYATFDYPIDHANEGVVYLEFSETWLWNGDNSKIKVSRGWEGRVRRNRNIRHMIREAQERLVQDRKRAETYQGNEAALLERIPADGDVEILSGDYSWGCEASVQFPNNHSAIVERTQGDGFSMRIEGLDGDQLADILELMEKFRDPPVISRRHQACDVEESSVCECASVTTNGNLVLGPDGEDDHEPPIGFTEDDDGSMVPVDEVVESND